MSKWIRYRQPECKIHRQEFTHIIHCGLFESKVFMQFCINSQAAHSKQVQLTDLPLKTNPFPSLSLFFFFLCLHTPSPSNVHTEPDVCRWASVQSWENTSEHVSFPFWMGGEGEGEGGEAEHQKPQAGHQPQWKSKQFYSLLNLSSALKKLISRGALWQKKRTVIISQHVWRGCNNQHRTVFNVH